MDSLLDGFSIRRLVTEIIGYICLVVPVACSVWRYQRFPGVELTASVGAICGYILAALVVIVPIMFNSVCRLYSSNRPTVLMYIMVSALPSLTLLLFGTTTKARRNTAELVISLTIIAFWISMFKYILRISQFSNNDPDTRNFNKSVAKEVLCHDLPFLVGRVAILSLTEPRLSHFLFPLKNLILLVLGAVLRFAPCAQAREDAEDANEGSPLSQDMSTPLSPGLNKDESFGIEEVKLSLAA